MTTKQHFAPLDGLRGLAAAAVMLRHTNEEFKLPQFAGHGYLAVDFFFILSGFVICWAYEQRLATGWSKASFVRVRLIRLLPLIALGSILGGVVTGVGQHPLSRIIEATVLSMLAIPSPWSGMLFPFNSPLWSMFYELLSNAVYVVTRPRLSLRVLAPATAIAAVAVIIVAAKVGNLDAGFSRHLWWAGAFRLAFPFLAGVLIYRLYIRAPAPAARRLSWFLVAAMVAVFAIPKMTGVSGAGLDLVFSLFVLPAIVWFGLRTQVGPRLAGLCALGGELSYPIYVIHKPIVTATGYLARNLAEPERAAVACGCIAVIFGLAAVAARAYDTPIRRLLTSLTTRRKSPTVALAT